MEIVCFTFLLNILEIFFCVCFSELKQFLFQEQYENKNPETILKYIQQCTLYENKNPENILKYIQIYYIKIKIKCVQFWFHTKL